MPRPPRADAAGEIYHVLNRGNGQQTIFHKEADYEAFERVLVEGLEKFPVRLYAYCWLPNHWHMVLSPEADGAMSKLMYWVTMTHTARHHAHYQQTGFGHLYQGRYKSFPVQSDEHFFVVCRYVERNALAAGLCDKAEDWRFGSLCNWSQKRGSEIVLTSWPIARLPQWINRVNTPVTEKEAKQIRRAINRGQPFGDAAWIETTARQYNLESTLRKRGRPRKLPQTAK
jgi:putative transposase